MKLDRLLILHLLFLLLISSQVNSMELEKPMEVKPVAVEIEVPKSEHQVQLASSQGQTVSISYDAFLLSNTMKGMVEGLTMTGNTIEESDLIIPTNIDTKSLKRIAEILEKTREAQEKKQPLEQEVLPIIDQLTAEDTILFLKGIAYLGVPEEIFHYVLEHLNHLLIKMTDLTKLESILIESFSKEISEQGPEKYLPSDLRNELAKNLIDAYKIVFFNIFPFYLESRVLAGKHVLTLAFSPDGKWLAMGSVDSTACLWNVQNAEEVKILKGHKGIIEALAFNPDGKLLAAGSDGTRACLWDVRQPKEVKILKGYAGHTLVFSLDGKCLGAGSWDNIAHLWHLQSPEEVKVFEGHENLIITLAFSLDCKWLATVSLDKTARIWNVQNPKEVKVLKRHDQPIFGVAFSPDGKWLATGSDHTRLWNVQNLEEINVLKGHDGSVYGLAFSPDGKWLATGSHDNTVRLWNVQNPKEFKVLKACEGSIIKLAFAPDGQRLATRSGEGIVRLWALDKIYELANKLDYRQLMLLVKFSQLGTKAMLSNDYYRNMYNSITDSELRGAINKYFDLQ